MKLLQKILVVILSMAMVFSAFPFVIYADDPAVYQPDPIDREVPRYESDIGVGTDGKITITLSVGAVSDLLNALGDTEALKEALNAMMETEGELITLRDMMEIVPFDSILEIIIGGEGGLARLVRQLGGAHAVMDMMNVDRVLASITREVDPDNPGPYDFDGNGDLRNPLANTIGIITALEGFEAAINPSAVLSLNLDIHYDELLQYLDMNKLKTQFAQLTAEEKRSLFSDFDAFVAELLAGLNAGELEDNDGNPLSLGDLIDPSGVDAENINGIVEDLIAMRDDLLATVAWDIIAEGLPIPAAAYQLKINELKELLSDPEKEIFKENLIARIKDPANNVVTAAGRQTLALMIMENEDLTDEEKTEILQLLRTGDANGPYLDLDAVIAQAGTFLSEPGIEKILELTGFFPTAAEVWAVLKDHPEYYDETSLKQSLTPAGVFYLLRNIPGGSATIAELFTHEEYYDAGAFQAAVNQAGQNRVMQLMLSGAGAQEAVGQMLQEGLDDPTLNYFDLDALIGSVNSYGIEYLDANVVFDPAAVDETVMQGLFANSDYYLLTSIKTAVNPMGYEALFQEYHDQIPELTDEQIQEILSDTLYFDMNALYAVLAQAINQAGQTALFNWFVEHDHFSITIDDLKDFISDEANYNSTNLADSVFRTLNDDGVVGLVSLEDVVTLVSASALVQDPDINAFLRTRLSVYFNLFTVDEIMTVVNAHGGWDQFLPTTGQGESLYDYTSLQTLAMDYLDMEALATLLLQGNLANLTNLTKDGEAGSFAKIIRDGLVVSMSDLMNALMAAVRDPANPLTLQDFINLDYIFTLLEEDSEAMGDLLEQVEGNVLADELSDDLDTIVEALTEEQYSELVRLVLVSGDIRIDRILLTGYEVARKGSDGFLEFDFDAIVAAVWEIIPKLEYLGSDNFEGLLAAFNFRMWYKTTANEAKEKDIDVVIKLEGDLEMVRRAARVLNRYVNLEKTNNYFRLTINVPNVVTDVYRYILEEGDSPAIANLRQKLLAMEEMTGKEIADALNQMTVAEFVAGLRDFDITALYERIVNTGKVKSLLVKLQDYANLHVDYNNIATLDKLLEHFRRDDLSTISAIIDQVSEKLSADLRGALEKVAKVVDENEYAQQLVEKARSIPGFGKFFQDVTAQQVLAEYQGYDPIRAIVKYASDRLNQDFMSKFYSEKTAAELYQDGLDYAEEHLEGPYRRLCNLLVHLYDPDYVPESEAEEQVFSLIPQSLIDKTAEKSLPDFYRGNGTFSATKDVGELDLANLSERILKLAGKFLTMNERTRDYALTMLPTGTYTYSANVTVNFQELYQIDFYQKDGSKWFTTYLPKGIDPAIVPLIVVDDFEAIDWRDQPGDLGVKVESVTRDQALYPFYLEYFTVTYQYEGNEIGSEEVLDGSGLAEVPDDPALPDQPHDYDLRYYVTVGADEVEIDPATYIVTGDVTVTLKYVQLTDTVTWKNGDDVIYSEEVAYGETPVYDEATYGTPEKAADAQYTYTFAGWDADVVAVTGNATYTATFTPTVNQYTVKWMNGNTEIYSETLDYGAMPVYNTATYGTPAKEATAQYTYAFAGWDADVVAVTGNATYTATFTPTVNQYTVKWMNGNTEIYSETLDYGAMPVYNTATYGTPAKEATAQYTYTFTGWTPEVVAVTGEATYQATFSSEVNEYTVTYIYNNVEIGSEIASYGAGLAELPDAPEPPDQEHNWKLNYLVNNHKINPATYTVTGDVTITLVYVDVSAVYTVTYRYAGAQIGSEQVAVGGNLANLPEAPELPDQVHAWELRYYIGEVRINPQTYTVTRNVTITLVYVDVSVYYNVVYHFNGDEIGSEIVMDGEGLAEVPEDPALPDQTHVWELHYYVNGEEIDVATYVPMADTTIELVYVDVTPQVEYYTVTYLYEGEEIGSEEVAVGGNLANLPEAPELPDQTHTWELHYYVNGAEIDPETYTVTGNVTITLEYVDVTPEETVVIVINGEEIEAPIGTVVPIEITLNPGEQLTELPEGATLIDVIENSDGSTTYVFAVVAEPDLPPITYTVEPVKKPEYYITNGKIGEKQEGVEYDNGTEYYDGIYYMEIGHTSEKKGTLIWLWVLIGAAAVAVFVGTSYLIIVKNGFGPNVFTMIIIGIVTGIRTMSLGAYNLVTGKLFRKK